MKKKILAALMIGAITFTNMGVGALSVYAEETDGQTTDGETSDGEGQDGEEPCVHQWDTVYSVDSLMTCTEPGQISIHCTLCGESNEETVISVNAYGHSYEHFVTQATTTAAGKQYDKCEICGDVINEEVIPKASSISLAATSYVYDGTKKKPAVIVKGSDGTIIPAANYKVVYDSGLKDVGTYSVTITFRGELYSGTVTKSFTIVPKATALKSLVAGSKKLTAKWTKQAIQTTGYQVQYALNSKFSSAKTVTISKNTTVSKAISKLTSKKTYYVRIRTYKKVGTKAYYSAWSKAKSVKVK